MSNIDCEHTTEVVCPYCGREHSDSWELSDSGTVECWNPQCEREFGYERITSVVYSASKLPDGGHS